MQDNATYYGSSGVAYNKFSFNGGNTWMDATQDTATIYGYSSNGETLTRVGAAFKMVFATGEIVVGIVGAPESGGTSLVLVIDGVTRFGTNLADFIEPGQGAENLGALIGRNVSGADVERWGGLINDALVAFTGNGMVGEFYEAGAAFSAGKYGTGSYYFGSGVNAGIDIYNIFN